MPQPQSFTPDLTILPAAQRRLWGELTDVPKDFTLYGGTAIALQLGHRESVDFDFFGRTLFDPDDLIRALPFLKGAEILQRAPDTLTVRVDRNGPVLISFFATPELGRIRPPLIANDNDLKVASLIDLAGMKADVVQKRPARKDYTDIATLLGHGITLPEALSAAAIIQGPGFNPQITLKALAYFGDGDLNRLPPEVKQTLQTAVAAVDLDALPRLKEIDRPHGAPGATP